MRVRQLIFILFTTIVLYGCAAKPPHEEGNFKANDLVELIKLDTSIHLDIHYATNNNFVGRSLYKEARAFLQRPAAEALVRVNASLKPLGFGLVVFDGYRPWSVTKLFWKVTPPDKHNFVANPVKGSIHNRGCAVDLSLYDLHTGKEIEMTGNYDEMTERSYSDYTGGTEQERKMRDLLRAKMEAEGFKVIHDEWWHFDYKDWKSYRISNESFDKIK